MKQINNPEDFGLSISSYDCLEGQVPCLLVEPDGIAGAGKRGKLLRQQLAAKRVELTAYGQVRGIVVLLHGRNGRKEDLLPVAERFVAAGFRCVLLDLPAHGDSPIESMSFGSSEFERQIPRRVLTEVKSQFGLPDEPAVLWGLSMGVKQRQKVGMTGVSHSGLIESYLVQIKRLLSPDSEHQALQFLTPWCRQL